ncbi:MAG: RNA polymerase sigma factor [Acidobacteriota bacterium]
MPIGSDSEAQTRELIERVVARDDHAAFADLVRQHQSPVRQFLRRLTRTDPERADDLAQETFWKAYRHLASYRGDGRFLSWLFKIAYQIFLSEERRGKLRLAPLPADRATGLIEGEQVIASRSVDAMLGQLRGEERAAILLHYRHELTHPEVATALGLPLGTVKSLIRRGRDKMRTFHETTGRARRRGEHA